MMVLNLTFFVIAFIVASRMKRPFYAHCEDEAAAETMRRDEDEMQTENMAPEKVDRQDDTPSDSGRIFFTKHDDNSVVVGTWLVYTQTQIYIHTEPINFSL